jgi:hypothetical protein
MILLSVKYYRSSTLSTIPFYCVRLLVLGLGRAIVQAVSRRLLTAKARVCSLGSPHGICGGYVALEQVSSRVLFSYSI